MLNGLHFYSLLMHKSSLTLFLQVAHTYSDTDGAAGPDNFSHLMYQIVYKEGGLQSLHCFVAVCTMQKLKQ